MKKRVSGILLHITSLPSSYGIGDLGPGAYSFVDFLKEANQSFWQILPLNPTSNTYGNCPYSSFSAFAGDPLLISPELMVEDGILSMSDIESHPSFLNKSVVSQRDAKDKENYPSPSPPPLEGGGWGRVKDAFQREKVNYRIVTKYKEKILGIAYEKNKKKLSKDPGFEKFCSENSHWLDDYSLFIAIKRHFNKVNWSKWPEDLRDRRKGAIKEWKERLKDAILRERFIQYVFFKQWYALKDYCSSKKIGIIGDMPMYVIYDSSDVWSNPEIFKLNERKMPAFVAGVPPDYFSSTGQLWGQPVYKWDVLQQTQYSWWVKRMGHNLKLFHMFRLDHFRGFVAYWEVPVDEETAVNGRWVKAPAKDFFSTLLKYFTNLSLIAEDLGVITPDVREIMNLFGFPGTKVLLFAFGEDLPANSYAPHNHTKNCVVYTGTHDNNTIKGWFKKETTPEDRKRLSQYIGREVSEKNIHWEVIRLAMMSVADMVIIPMQDILGLGEKARMNLPASSKGNWQWRLTAEQLSPSLIKKLSEMTMIYGRG